MTLSKQTERGNKLGRDDVRIAARDAWLRLIEPLAEFAVDCGLSIRELSSILREAAVRNLAAQQLEAACRPSISGIAASTGIPRGEISRILKKTTSSIEQNTGRHQQSTSKVLGAWCKDPKYTTANGRPADLKIYGRGATFETLVKSHGNGIPTRAMLDELRRRRLIEVRSSQEIRLSTIMSPERRITPQAIKAFGDRATEVLTIMLQNIRHAKSCVNIGSISGKMSPNSIPLIRKEISKKGEDFLADIRNVLLRGSTTDRANDSSATTASLVSVAIFFVAASPKYKGKGSTLARRRNFRRSL
jgi:hypothetical protein